MCNIPARHSATHISFVYEYETKFNAEDFHYGKLYKKEIAQKYVAGNLGYSFTVFCIQIKCLSILSDFTKIEVY